jgi:hypothetical protein
MYDNDIQKIRKENLKLVIDKYASSSVDKLSKDLDKHRTYVYAMLKGMGENNPRAITSKMSRLIESTYGLPLLSLDNPNYRNEILGLTGKIELENLIPKMSFEYIDDKFISNLSIHDYINISAHIVPSKIDNRCVSWFDIDDDLMSPKIESQSKVFIETFKDFQVDDIVSSAIYIIGYNKKIQIVRIFIEIGNIFKLKVDNPLKQNIFPELSIGGNQFIYGVQVFGRVIGSLTFNKEFL